MSKSKMWFAICVAVAMGFASTGCDETKKAKPETPKEEVKEESKEAPKEGASAKPQPTSQAASTPAKPKVPFTATGPVAKVNGNEVTAETFNSEVESMMRMMPMLPPGQAASMKPRVLDNVISKVLIEEATKGEVGNVKAADLDKEYARFEESAKKQPGGTAAVFSRMGVTEASFKDELKKSLALKLTLEKNKVQVQPKDSDIKKFYEENKKRRYEKPDQVKASHILFKVEKDAPADKVAEAKKKAEDITKKAKAPGADFAALAKEHSEGPSGPRGGDLGFFSKERMVPEFSKAAFSMKPGEVSKPVKTQFGFHVIKVVEKQKAQTVPLKDVKEEIAGQLENQMMRSAVKTFIEDLKKKATIEKMEANIKDNPEFAKGAPSAPMLNLGKGGLPNQKLKLTPPKPGQMKKPGAP